jgi:hypothetical protein
MDQAMMAALRARITQAGTEEVPVSVEELLALLAHLDQLVTALQALGDQLTQVDAARVQAEGKVREALQAVSQISYMTGAPSPRFVVRGDVLFAILTRS